MCTARRHVVPRLLDTPDAQRREDLAAFVGRHLVLVFSTRAANNGRLDVELRDLAFEANAHRRAAASAGEITLPHLDRAFDLLAPSSHGDEEFACEYGQHQARNPLGGGPKLDNPCT